MFFRFWRTSCLKPLVHCLPARTYAAPKMLFSLCVNVCMYICTWSSHFPPPMHDFALAQFAWRALYWRGCQLSQSLQLHARPILLIVILLDGLLIALLISVLVVALDSGRILQNPYPNQTHIFVDRALGHNIWVFVQGSMKERQHYPLRSKSISALVTFARRRKQVHTCQSAWALLRCLQHQKLVQGVRGPRICAYLLMRICIEPKCYHRRIIYRVACQQCIELSMCLWFSIIVVSLSGCTYECIYVCLYVCM